MGHETGVRSNVVLYADTNPTNSADYFEMTQIAFTPNATLHFNSSSNRQYTLYSRTNLLSDDWKPVSASRMGTGGADSLQSTNNVPQEFYKITVELP